MNRKMIGEAIYIRVITTLPNSEQSHKGKVKTHHYIDRPNQSTTGKHVAFLSALIKNGTKYFFVH
jgi:hypothetical protein